MNTRIEYALAWKELRQSLPIFIAFNLLSLFFVGYASYVYNYDVQNTDFHRLSQIGEYLFFFVLIVSLGLAYLFACGNRILEAGENLEPFLFTRPVERYTLIKVYYTISLSEVVSWLGLFVLLVYLFFGANASKFYEQKIEPGYFFFLLWMLTAHGITFVISLIYPTLVVTSTVFLGTYFGCIFITTYPQKILVLIQDLYFSGVLHFFALFAIAVYGAVYLYNQKQIS